MNTSKTILPDVSVVLAVQNVEDVIGRAVRRLADHMRKMDRPFEIVAVNDGSWDTSFKVLRLLSREMSELKLVEKDVSSRAFIRGSAEASGQSVVLMDAGHLPSSLSPIGWSLSRLDQGSEAVVVRGRWVAARRLPALPAIARPRGRGDMFERSFERESRDLAVEVVGTARRAPSGLLAPVWRLLAA